MPPLKPGFYCATSPNASEMVATDQIGPFDTLWDLCEWMLVFGVMYRPERKAARITPLCWGEMTDQESAGVWATAVQAIGP